MESPEKTVSITMRVPESVFERVMGNSFVFPNGFKRGEITRAFIECIELGLDARDRD